MGRFKTIAVCRLCGRNTLYPCFDLGRQPLANSLSRKASEKEATYPLALLWCGTCFLVQLSVEVDPAILFKKYRWVSGTSAVTRTHATRFFSDVRRRLRRRGPFSVLEVGSNDGTFLKPFIAAGHHVLGVDPAENIVAIANREGIPSRAAFFGMTHAKRLCRERGLYDLVFARNVLPHVANTRDFAEGLVSCLAPHGLLIIEVHYGKTILDELHYDSIYHEHLCYFTLQSLEALLQRAGVWIEDVGKSPISGGSLVVYARNYPVAKAASVRLLAAQEARDRTNELSSWRRFKRRAEEHREEFRRILLAMKKKGERIVGYGASARSGTLLNFCGLNRRDIPVIADQNPLKHNRVTAGTHIPVKSPQEVFRRQPSIVVILAWNFADEIISLLKRKFHFKGRGVIPLPYRPRVITVA